MCFGCGTNKPTEEGKQNEAYNKAKTAAANGGPKTGYIVANPNGSGYYAIPAGDERAERLKIIRYFSFD